ncbi:iron ABC transporter permease [Paenibacillus sp. P96]|uniref:Iron ABC transporter permease n=1 Tax=Paenibacillus zeirhizosphaerae TaxID=2987519 RepID=A0ABT9FQU4_9BACL|nr:iron ABC transporter permease [Paenibacillus sp. P96]MDP4096896.1 iron ABC transporter permease [Paenibacillus sp. P96]
MIRSKLYITLLWFLFSCAVLVITTLAAVSFGAKEASLAAVWSAVFFYDPSITLHTVIHDLRLPRVLGAAITGAAFATAGALMQGVTRNPLADTGVLGINAGAACAVAISFAIAPSISYSLLMIISFAGAALSTLFIVMLGLSTKGGLTSLKLTIAGSVVAAMLHSLSTGIAIYYDLSQDLAFWYAGGAAGVRWEHLRILVPLILVTLLFAFAISRPINFLSLGEETAANLGVHTGRVRVLALAAVVVLAGASVSVVGSISFVGLVVPHLVRRFVGVDYRVLVPLSGLWGAILLMWADFASRMVNPPREFAIGAMVAIVGVPFFLYLARQERREL